MSTRSREDAIDALANAVIDIAAIGTVVCVVMLLVSLWRSM